MADRNLATGETQRLIASDKVEGTAVYNLAGERLGTLHNFMVNKLNGKVEYAVLNFGGLFGMGGDHYPLPWEVLKYDTGQNGYVVDLAKSVLEQAPRYQDTTEPAFDERYGQEVYGYYGLNYPF